MGRLSGKEHRHFLNAGCRQSVASALHRHGAKPESSMLQCVLGIPWSQAAKSRGEWEARPRISSLNAQGIWQRARLPAGLSPLLRAHSTGQVSDTQRQPHTGALAVPCRAAYSLGRLSACSECPSATPVLPSLHHEMKSMS